NLVWCLRGMIRFIILLLVLSSRRSTLFPYTPLFRSALLRVLPAEDGRTARPARPHREEDQGARARVRVVHLRRGRLDAGLHAGRSEEHTSELQSRENLVCRLLLEKKKEE